MDTTSPECVGLPDFVSESTELGNAGRTVTWTEPTCSDASNAASVTARSDIPGAFFFVGETVVTYTCTDPSGNSESCSFIVQVFTSKSEITVVTRSVDFTLLEYLLFSIAIISLYINW